jgi:hypothetical protein
MYDLRQNSVLTGEYQQIIQDQYGMGLNSIQGAVGGSTGESFLHKIFWAVSYVLFFPRFCECTYSPARYSNNVITGECDLRYVHPNTAHELLNELLMI